MWQRIWVRTFPYLTLLLLAACGGEPAAPAPTTEPPPAATATVAAEPAAATDTPQPPATPTTAPPPTEAVETPELALERLGILRFADNDAARSGAFTLEMRGVPAPPVGSHYEVWLVGDDGALLNLGEAPLVDGNVIYSGDTGEVLIGTYSKAQVTVQPDGETSSAPDNPAFTGLIPMESLVHIRHIIFEFPQNPDGQGFLLGAQSQVDLAREHSLLLQEALAADDLDEGRRHAEHVVNILDGEEGEFYGDLDGDGVAQNPGDGVGVRAYLRGAQQHAQLAADAETATDEVKLHAEHTVIAGDNALGWLDEAISAAIRVISADSVAEAQPSADALGQLVADIIAGRDVNGDGSVAPVEGEGGMDTAYQHALLMGGFEIFPGDLVAAELFDPGGEGDEDAVDVTEETAPAEITVEMLDFTYSETEITVSTGTAIHWVNRGEFQHSATAADGAWDTELHDTGGEATINFDAPGTYIFYCTLHGTPDGSGMAGTLVVTDD